ncbi:hypothetical protein BLNAU_23244 [Blattamonas nauphoetae]|uniref:Uncharacterized protein n=1 Tax=Blattamonas nauphoetae TaxID=2049346 RepID=A0ABQ9WR92_9EUKA|nr:hypothetical protein BLNAU_23244 [Blattamonas nauphoetae]
MLSDDGRGDDSEHAEVASTPAPSPPDELRANWIALSESPVTQRSEQLTISSFDVVSKQVMQCPPLSVNDENSTFSSFADPPLTSTTFDTIASTPLRGTHTMQSTAILHSASQHSLIEKAQTRKAQ